MHNGHSWRGPDLDGTVTRFSPPWYGPLPRKICGASPSAVASDRRLQPTVNSWPLRPTPIPSDKPLSCKSPNQRPGLSPTPLGTACWSKTSHGRTNATTPNRNPVADQRTIERIIATANEVEAPRVLRGGQRQDCDNLIRVANRSQRQQDWDGSAIRFRTVAPAK